MTNAPDPSVQFAERVLSLLDEGRFTSTYKYGVLLGLMDLCLEGTSRAGQPPDHVTTQQLAAKLIELYWPQSLPYREQGVVTLKQNRGKPATLTKLIGAAQAGLFGETLPRWRTRDPASYRALVRDVEWTLVKMPLPKLQRFGNETRGFIYHIAWDDDISRRQWRSPDFDNRIHFVGQSALHLVRLTGLLRPIIQRSWSNMVARLNRSIFPHVSLDEFLFGASRPSLTSLRKPLLDLQHGRCFYCRKALRVRTEVDHFVPWSRYPDNGLDNLVLVHPECNRQKSNHFAATDHVMNLVERSLVEGSRLQAIQSATNWERQAERTLGVLRGVYLHLPEDARLWRSGEQFEAPIPEQLAGALSGSPQCPDDLVAPH